MSRLLELTEGWTGPLPFTLKADGTAVNLTGLTVELILKDCDGNVVGSTGDLAVTTAANGLVTYSPDPTDLTVDGSPYSVHFKVTDVSGKVVYFPNGPADILEVYPE